MDLFLECTLFVVGLVFGSFLNVCISRIPRDQSIVRPASHCRSCNAPIRWYDNVPIISWLLLRGCCRDCRARISFRYPAVELLTASLFAACYFFFGPGWLTLKFCVFCFLIVGLIFMDAETGLLPHEFTYPGIALGLAFCWFAPTDTAATQLLTRAYGGSLTKAPLAFVDSLLGVVVGAGFFYLAWALYYLVRKRHGLGFGDIALMAMAGAFLGLKLALFVLFVAPLLGVLYAVILLVRSTRRQSSSTLRETFLHGEFPFGIFLGVASLLAVFFGGTAWQWYLGFF